MNIAFLFAIACIFHHLIKLSTGGDTCIDNSYSQELRRGHEQMLQNVEYNVITKTIILDQGTPIQARQNIRRYFTDTFDLDTSLFRLIKPQYLWSRADPLRHPVCWYAAHSAAFYINKLRLTQVIKAPLNRSFEYRFAVGVDEMSWDDKLEDQYDWPPPQQVFEYRNNVRHTVLNIIHTASLTLPIEWNSVFYAILMGIEHERIHIETSSVLIRQLPLHVFHNHDQSLLSLWDNTCKLAEFELNQSESANFNELIPVQGKHVTYGRKINDFSNQNTSAAAHVYGWDNEFGEMSMDVPAFKASKYLVSNEEYYQFVLDDGYNTRQYWTDEGWNWVQSTNANKPFFWIQDDVNGTFYLRNMMNLVRLPWNWPVITNHLEGLAFTKWKSFKSKKSIRLLTEDEWHVLRQLGEYANIDQPLWEAAPGNINLEYYTSECPIDMFQWKGTQFYDIIGNVWQHTLTPQHPFRGFQVHAIYDDFTVPCFGPNHNIIKGGSWISTGNIAIAYSRYQFRRHFFQHAGIRYVESDRDMSYLNQLAERNPYNDDKMVSSYTHFAYSNETYFGNINTPNYPKYIAQIGINTTQANKRIKALDVGCSVGRTAFELAKEFESVIAIDITTRLIGVAYRMQENEFLEWKLSEQGNIDKHYTISAKELGIEKTLKNVKFVQNDAQNMDMQYKDFDLIIASNLIDRLSNPLLFVTNIHQRANIGARFLLCDPYSWKLQYTSRDKWIGGIVNETDHTPIYSEHEIKKILLATNKWKFIEEMDVPLIIKEHKRKFQYINTHCVIFERI